MSSPTQRTLAELRARGYEAEVVERWNQFAKRRVDLFGCIDIVACKAASGGAMWAPGSIIGIQCTSGSNHAARLEKARQEPRLQAWLAAGGQFAVWSWRKSAAGKWVLREEGL